RPSRRRTSSPRSSGSPRRLARPRPLSLRTRRPWSDSSPSLPRRSAAPEEGAHERAGRASALHAAAHLRDREVGDLPPAESPQEALDRLDDGAHVVEALRDRRGEPDRLPEEEALSAALAE